MRKSYRLLGALLTCHILSIAAFAQNTVITGNVRNALNKDGIPAVSITIKGGSAGTFTDERGNFRFTTIQKPPFTLIFSSIGFEQQEVSVSNATDSIHVDFVPASMLGAEVVVSASRVPERILESPVSIERISSANIRNSPSTGYYDMLRYVKGVDLVYSSLTFATPSTRGFNGSGNARLNQLVDGMDNQAPGLNFAVGSVIGLTELDVESVELLPGASSALYGPGGMNGTILINSKNPFRYQGFSFQAKTGIMHVDKKQLSSPSPFYDWSMRWAKTVGDKFAFKIGAQFIHAKDWIGIDSTNYQAGDVSLNQYGNTKPGTRNSDPNYDGVNVYGDETSFGMLDITNQVLAAATAQYQASYFQATGTQPTQAQVNTFLATNPQTQPFYVGKNNGIITNQFVSRTGYREREVVNNNTINFKLSGGLYYRLTPAIELSLTGNWGTGNTVYTGSDRYSLKDLKLGQYKLEIRHRDWFARAYTTQENAGESYNATITTRLFNEKWQPSQVWFPTYIANFVGNRAAGRDVYNSHLAARTAADVGRPEPGSDQFKKLFDQVRTTPISKGGGLFLDKSDLYLVEGQYNFGDKLKLFNLILGASAKRYVLNSQGTLFADTAGNINIDEVGGYAQIARGFMNDRLKLTASGRYDYNENFPARFTPRFTAVVKLAQDHNFRASYQTAYRFPTTQNQWINLVVGGGTVLLGGLPELREFYNFKGNKVYTVASVQAAGAALASGQPPATAFALLEERQFGDYKPETMKSVEAGYKGLVNKKILIDLYGYYGKYENFLGRTIVLQANQPGNQLGLFSASTRKSISVAVNSPSKVTTYGYGAGVDWLLPKNFIINASYSSDKITDVPTGFVAFFNAPTYRVIVGLSNTGFGYQKRMGFSAQMRTQDGYFYESDFRQGGVDDYTTVDAQVSYKFPASKSMIKLGASNLLNKYYKTSFGNPEIGGIYYVSFAFNVY
ncbi:MAG TPA: TonB-dependent receptor [Flavitalea sp.]|nr:TonB-dependent receptor [Flavitalea sp.]